jgi:hypothetical protein
MRADILGTTRVTRDLDSHARLPISRAALYYAGKQARIPVVRLSAIIG